MQATSPPEPAPADRGSPRTVPTGGGRPRLGIVFAGYVAAIAASALTGGVAASLTGDADGMGTMVAGQIGFWAVLVATVLYEAPGRGRPIVDRVGLRFRLLDAPVGLIVGVATQLVVVPALYLPFRSLVDDEDLSGPARDLLGDASGLGLVVIGVSVVVAAPVVEELFFRGLLLEAMQRRWGTIAALVASSVVFGATHFQPVLLPALATAGAVFAVSAVRTGRLGTAIAVHAAFNATTFVAVGLLS